MQNNLLIADSLQLSLGGKKVVDNINFTIKENEFIGLIGPNGAGKSSILKMLAGIIHPDAGEIDFCINKKNNPQKISAVQRAQFLAYLAQHETPAWPLSVKNLVALGRSPWNHAFTASHQDDTAVINALRMTGLGALAERSVNALSGGELQRVLLARVFAGEPQLIVADEPIAALDVYHQLHIMELLQAHACKGGAVIAALHDLSLAARFCSRLILIHHGRVVADGEPITVLTPENLALVYGISAHVDCREDGVVIIPVKRVGNL